MAPACARKRRFPNPCPAEASLESTLTCLRVCSAPSSSRRAPRKASWMSLHCQLTSESGKFIVRVIAPMDMVRVHPGVGGAAAQWSLPLPFPRGCGRWTGCNTIRRCRSTSRSSRRRLGWQVALVFLVTLGAVPVLSRWLLRLPWRPWAAAAGRQIRRHPRRASLVCAAFSAILSCFPVVFCGMSFISPDNGVQTSVTRAPPGCPARREGGGKSHRVGHGGHDLLAHAGVDDRASGHF